MDFRTAATSETSALIGRLIARRADVSARDIRALRQAFEAAAQAAEIAAAGRSSLEEDNREIAALIERLADAAAADVKAATTAAQAEAQKAIAALRAQWSETENERKRLAAQLSTAQAQVEAVEAESLKRRTAVESAQAEARTHKAVAEAAQNEAKTYKTAAEAAQAEARSHRAAAEAAQTEARTHRAAVDAAQADVARITRQLEMHAAERTSARAEIARLTKQVEAIGAEKNAASAEVARLAKQGEAQAAEKAKLVAALKQAQQQLLAGESQQQALAAQWTERAAQSLDRLSSTFARLGTATHTDEVLEAVADGLGEQGSRVALFRVKGQTLEGTYQSGFDSKTDISKVVIPLTIDSVFSGAVSADHVEVFATGDLPEQARVPFGGTPASALIVPISACGETVAVIYADDGAPGAAGGSLAERATIADLLRLYAVALLDKLAGDLKALAELRAYAKLLVNEIEHMYEADVAAGKKAAEIHSRVRENIECARQIYAQRVEVEGPAAAPLLEERLAAVALGKAATPFGHELALATGHATQKGSRQAQAS
jgi:hypothetical protein